MSRVVSRARWRAAVAATAMLLVATGCSDEEPPGDSAPALADRLDKVDAAIEDGDYDAARKAVEELAAETAQARIEGDITDEQAERIFEAVEDVRAELPEPKDEDEDKDKDEPEPEDGG